MFILINGKFPSQLNSQEKQSFTLNLILELVSIPYHFLNLLCDTIL